MNRLFSGAHLQWVDQIALLAGRRLDLVYASLVHQLRLSPGFFRQGWGDLGVVNFEEDAKLFREWPPPHFDQQVGLVPAVGSQQQQYLNTAVPQRLVLERPLHGCAATMAAVGRADPVWS